MPCLIVDFHRFHQMQDGGDSYVSDSEHDTIKDVVDINVVSACLFMVLASVFLLILYYFMSHWFLLLLVILFCVGGFEVLRPSLRIFFILFLLVLNIISPKLIFRCKPIQSR